MCAVERDQLELDVRNVIAGRGAKRLPRKRTTPVDESKSTSVSDVAQQPSTRHQWKLIAISGAQRISGTVRTTTQAAVTNALKQLTTIDVTQLTVKRKFNTAVNDPTRLHKWWFIVQGEEDLLQQHGTQLLSKLHGSWSQPTCTRIKIPHIKMGNALTDQQLPLMVNQHLPMIVFCPTMAHCVFF